MLTTDLRHARRLLTRQPLLAAVALVTLALGTGVNTAMFSVVHAVLLRPLPYAQPERVLRLWEDSPEPGEDPYLTSAGLVRAWRAAASLEAVSEYWLTEMNLAGLGANPDRVKVIAAGPDLARVLGVWPARGRWFVADDYTGGVSNSAAVLSWGYWQQRYGGREDVLGRMVRLDDRLVTLVGILPPGVDLDHAQIWLNHNDANTQLEPRYLHALARLRPDVAVGTARAELVRLTDNARKASGRTPGEWSVIVRTIADDTVGATRPALLVLMGAVSLLLLITCANVASLLLAQAEGRRREMAVRAALGASGTQLTRQLLTESGLLVSAGTALGVAFAWGAIGVLRTIGPETLPRLNEVALDWVVLLYALAIAGATSVVFGLAPLWRARRPDVQAALSDAGRGSSGGRAARLVRHGLVVGEMALAVILVTAAALLVQSFARLSAADLGFTSERRLTFSVALPEVSYETPAKTADLFERLLARIDSAPGVVKAGATTTLPLGRDADFRLNFTVNGQPLRDAAGDQLARYRMVSPGYFAAMGIALREGRSFTEADREDAPPVVIVNEALARRWAGGRSAVGITMGAASGGFGPLGRILTRTPRIVGVVADVRQAGLDRGAEPSIFYPLRQAPFRNQTIVVHATGDPLALAADMRRIVAEIDPELPLAGLATLDQHVARAASAPRFRTGLIASFAILALALGAAGLYGVLSVMVTARTREIGIRLALGGRPADVRALVLRQSLALVAIGTALGLPGAFVAVRLLSGLLYGIAPHDPLTFAAVPVVLVVTGLLAGWVPTRRAAATDPATVLRQ